LEQAPPRKILRKPAVRARTGYGDTQIWRLERAGRFPKRVRLSPMAVGWFEDEIEEWVLSRVRGTGKQPPLPKARREAALSEPATTGRAAATIESARRVGSTSEAD
jgi:prophage regulatory protein